jgi:hypothetical protein
MLSLDQSLAAAIEDTLNNQKCITITNMTQPNPAEECTPGQSKSPHHNRDLATMKSIGAIASSHQTLSQEPAQPDRQPHRKSPQHRIKGKDTPAPKRKFPPKPHKTSGSLGAPLTIHLRSITADRTFPRRDREP